MFYRGTTARLRRNTRLISRLGRLRPRGWGSAR